jgi:ERCC4-type nuclease
MIRVAKDTGSIELLPLLQKLGAPAEKANLHFADFAFQGEGTDGSPIPIGVERKTLGDFVSSILNGRLPGHQLPGMLKCYAEIWIVLEGDWRICKFTGHVQTLQWTHTKTGKKIKRWRDLETGLAYALGYQELESMVVTLEMRGGVRVRKTRDQMETVRFVKALFHWWTDKSFAQHRSHLKFHSQFADQGLLTKPSLCRVIASQLPGIGFEKSGKVAAHFGSVAAMVEATEKDWEKIEGVGPVLSKRIVEKLVVAGATV